MSRAALVAALVGLASSGCVLRHDWSAFAERAASDAIDDPAALDAALGDHEDAAVLDGSDAGSCGPGARPCDAVRIAARGARFALGVVDGAPTISVRLSSDFWLDSTEVTVERYAAHLRARGSTELRSSITVAYPGATVVVSAPTDLQPGRGGDCNWDAAGRELHPLNCVSWSAAMVFCAESGGRLPTEAEYAWVARYRMNAANGISPFPWGARDPRADRMDGGVYCDLAHRSAEGAQGSTCDFAESRAIVKNGGKTAPVRSFAPEPRDVYDLVGNVAEWSADRYVDLNSATRDCFTGEGELLDPLCETANSTVDVHAYFGGDYRADNAYSLYTYKRGRLYNGDPLLPPWVGFRCVYPAL